jgi:hypothetical protein
MRCGESHKLAAKFAQIQGVLAMQPSNLTSKVEATCDAKDPSGGTRLRSGGSALRAGGAPGSESTAATSAAFGPLTSDAEGSQSRPSAPPAARHTPCPTLPSRWATITSTRAIVRKSESGESITAEFCRYNSRHRAGRHPPHLRECSHCGRRSAAAPAGPPNSASRAKLRVWQSPAPTSPGSAKEARQ